MVNVSATFRQDVKLTVGAESQTVTVSADALTVQTDSNVVSTLISSEQISEIATENRNFAALASLGLGVSSALPDSNTPTSVAASFTLSINGLRQSHNIWLIDGGEADDRGGAGGMDIMPSQDAIAEFNVLASNYPPDYGISSGATMSLSLKSGTQKFHGEAWEFNRTTDYNANNFFNKLSTPATPRASTHYNIFGYNIGGPLYIPHVYNTNKQKTFFFYNEEWRKVLSSAGTNEQNTLDPADIPKAGQNLTYVASEVCSATSTWWCRTSPPTAPTGSRRSRRWALQYQPNKPWPNGQIPASLFDSNGLHLPQRRHFPGGQRAGHGQEHHRGIEPDFGAGYGSAHRPQVQRQVGDPGPLHGRPGDAGLCGAGTGLAVGQLQHPHQHAVEPVAVGGHQAVGNHQPEPAAWKPASTTTATCSTSFPAPTRSILRAGT